MGRSCYAGISVNFFIAAAFLLLFGITAQNNGGAHGPLQLVLAVLMAGGGIVLRTSHSPEARLTGLGAAGVTTAVGVFLTVTGKGYVPGTIVAIIALIQLASVQVVRRSDLQPVGSPLPPVPAPPMRGQSWPTPSAATSPFEPPPVAGSPYGQQEPAPPFGQQPPAPTYGQQPPYWAQPEVATGMAESAGFVTVGKPRRRGAAVGGTKDGATARGRRRTRVQRPLRRLSGP